MVSVAFTSTCQNTRASRLVIATAIAIAIGLRMNSSPLWKAANSWQMYITIGRKTALKPLTPLLHDEPAALLVVKVELLDSYRLGFSTG